MGPLLSVPLGILASLYTAKELGDIVAMVQGKKGGLEELLGVTPSEGQIAQAELSMRRGKAKGMSRMSRSEEVQSLKDKFNAFVLGGGADTDMFQAEQAMQAVARGSSITDILPTGMRPGALLQEMRLNEVEAWRKFRDAAPSDAPLAQAAKEGAAKPPQQGKLMQLAQGAGVVPGQAGAQQAGAQPAGAQQARPPQGR